LGVLVGLFSQLIAGSPYGDSGSEFFSILLEAEVRISDFVGVLKLCYCARN